MVRYNATMIKSLPLALQPPQSSVLIRPVRVSDTDGLTIHCWPGRPYMTVYNLLKRIAYQQTQKVALGVVAVTLDGQVCGYGQVVMWPTCAEVSDLIVTENLRGQGVGTAIVQTLVQAAAQLGAAEIEIGAAISNPRAAQLYRRLGFRDSHTVSLTIDGGKENVQFLRLSVPEPLLRRSN